MPPSWPEIRTRFGNELDADLGAGIDLLEVVNELGEVLDAVNVVVRRRGDEGDAGSAAPELRDHGADLVAGNLAAFARLGTLRHLDLDFRRAGEVFGRDAEAARGDLLDAAVLGIAVFHRRKPGPVFAALARVRFAADAVHGDGEGLVGLGGKRAEGHAGGDSTSSMGIGVPFFSERHWRRATGAASSTAATYFS